MSTGKETEWQTDSEIKTMSIVYSALRELKQEEQERILAWVVDRLGLNLRSRFGSGIRWVDSQDGALVQDFEEIAALYDAAGPKTDPQRALVAAYWFQVMEKQPSLDSQALNSALKNLGHGLGNVTDALSSLMHRKPALVLQTQKMGKSRQARKKYKLTTAGIRAVEAMIGGSAGEEE